MRRLWAYIRPYRGWFWAAMLCLPLTSACSLAQPYLLKIAIDRYMAQGDRGGLLRIGVLYGVAMLAEFGFLYLQYYLMMLVAQKQPGRPAPRPRRAPAAAAGALLRPQSGRPPGHAPDHRRRRDQRDVRRRRADHPHGRRHPARHRRHHADDRLAPGAGDPGAGAGARRWRSTSSASRRGATTASSATAWRASTPICRRRWRA